MTKVLFICMGNICRSPTAEGVVRAHVERAGLSAMVQLDSAGTHAYHVGSAPDPRTQTAAARRGYDLSRLRARQIREADFLRFDLILAMDRDNLSSLKRACPPEHHGKLGLFLHYAEGLGVDEVPDPYYGGPEGFEYVLNLTEQGARGLVDFLLRRK